MNKQIYSTYDDASLSLYFSIDFYMLLKTISFFFFFFSFHFSVIKLFRSISITIYKKHSSPLDWTDVSSTLFFITHNNFFLLPFEYIYY